MRGGHVALVARRRDTGHERPRQRAIGRPDPTDHGQQRPRGWSPLLLREDGRHGVRATGRRRRPGARRSNEFRSGLRNRQRVPPVGPRTCYLGRLRRIGHPHGPGLGLTDFLHDEQDGSRFDRRHPRQRVPAAGRDRGHRVSRPISSWRPGSCDVCGSYAAPSCRAHPSGPSRRRRPVRR